MKNGTLSDSIDAAIRSNRMEGLELSGEALEMLEKVKKGEMTLHEYEKQIIAKWKE